MSGGRRRAGWHRVRRQGQAGHGRRDPAGPVLSSMERTGHRVELAIGGMTCASCAARIERRLNRLDGVTATVNFATEKASVTYPSDVTPAQLIATVEKIGYRARPT